VNQKLQGVIFALIARAVRRRKKLGSGLGFLCLLILLLVSNNSFDALLGESDFRLALVTDFQLFLGGDDF